MVFALVFLCIAFLVAWVAFYLYARDIRCAFREIDGNTCDAGMPWQLSLQDMTIMMILPAAIFLGLLWWTRIVARRRR